MRTLRTLPTGGRWRFPGLLMTTAGLACASSIAIAWPGDGAVSPRRPQKVAPRPAPQPSATPQASPPASGFATVRPAPIGYLTAGTLADRCLDSSPAGVSYCFAYLAGVYDAARAYEIWLNQREFCVPEGTPQSDLRRAFLTYVSVYPSNRGGLASSVVIVSLKETYPCLATAPSVGSPGRTRPK